MNQKFYTFLLLFGLLSTMSFAQQITITDASLVGNTVYNWTADNEYLLDGYVFLEEGSVLNIEPGTVIKGKQIPSSNDVASALIITRGAQINAIGTAQQPIIFTAEEDDVNDPTDLGPTDRGAWGGLIILGRASITANATEIKIEGVATADPDDPRILFGAPSAAEWDDEDNSGTLRYVSVRHGGSKLEDGDEINGITLGAVGSGTTIEFVEVYANDDDGIEWFGGTVDVKFAAVGFCRDDSYDWDNGFKGKGQFWLSIHGADSAGNGGELDGAQPDDANPGSNPTVYNATFIGAGADNTVSGQDDDHALLFRDNSAGKYGNSIFTDFAGYGIQVEDIPPAEATQDSYLQLQDGELVISNSLWFGFGEGNELNAGPSGFILVTDPMNSNDTDASDLINMLATNGNALDNPQITSISRTTDGNFDPRPVTTGPAYENLGDLPEDDDFFTEVNFKGAFGATLWVRGWTALSDNNHLPAQQEVVIRDSDLTGSSDETWTSDNVYILDGYVFLEEGGSLTIEPGTVVKGQQIPSSTDVASALIITRGATIIADGTEQEPIIFTAEEDDLTDPDDLGCSDRGLWGGLIILGRGSITANATEIKIEGVATADPDDPRILFGASSAAEWDDTDNSGVLRYVSVRHAGSKLEDGDEINGITLGAVGSGTTIEFVEVFANDDDGIEWFGGAVNVKYAVVTCCRDDSYDWDNGFKGNGQFWLSLHGADAAGNGGELDGAQPDDANPGSNPTVYNATFIGAGADNTVSGQDDDHALLFRDNSAGTFANSIFTDYAGYGIQVEDIPPAEAAQDSYQQLLDGELVLANSIWFGFGEGNELNAGPSGFILVTDPMNSNDPDASELIQRLADSGNSLDNPQLNGISRTTDGGFDPRPASDGPAYTTPSFDYPEDDFFTPVTFKGAFCDDGVWIQGWTATAEYGILDQTIPTIMPEMCDVVSTDNLFTENAGFILAQNMPNPATGTTTIDFVLPTATNVSLVIFDAQGKVVSTVLDNARMPEGENRVEADLTNLASGMYFYSLFNNEVRITRALSVK
ncbi:MAG: T9SS type A sorting domain-containing protein [Bacteroidota bacterium]